MVRVYYVNGLYGSMLVLKATKSRDRSPVAPPPPHHHHHYFHTGDVWKDILIVPQRWISSAKKGSGSSLLLNTPKLPEGPKTPLPITLALTPLNFFLALFLVGVRREIYF